MKMLIKKINKYEITHAGEINENLNIIKDFYNERIDTDKILKKVNYEAYEKLEKMLNSIKPIKSIYDLKSLLLFYNESKSLLRIIEHVPRKLTKLESAGYSISSFDQHTTVININKIMENIYALYYYLPRPEYYLICSSEIKNMNKQTFKKFGEFLTQNKLYEVIALLRLEIVAAPIRQLIGVTPIRVATNIVTFMMQRYGMIPKSNFTKSRENIKSADLIIHLGNGDPQYYYNSFNINKETSSQEGISADMIKHEIIPCLTASTKSVPLKHKSKINNIYETFDGKMYRHITTYMDPMVLIRGPSHIANGYNSQFADKFKKHVTAPLIADKMINAIKNRGRQQYADIRTTLRGKKGTDIIDQFLEHIVEQLNFDRHQKILVHELSLMIASEKIKLNRKLKMTKSLDDFFDDVIGDRDNLILNFERKVKIYNAGKAQKQN